VSVSKLNVTPCSDSQWSVKIRSTLNPSDSVRIVTCYPYATPNNTVPNGIPYLCSSFLYPRTCANFLCVCQFLLRVPVSCACANFLCVCQFLVSVPVSCACANFLCLCQFLVRVPISCAFASFLWVCQFLVLVPVSCGCANFLCVCQFLIYMPIPRPFWKPFDTLFPFIWLQLWKYFLSHSAKFHMNSKCAFHRDKLAMSNKPSCLLDPILWGLL